MPSRRSGPSAAAIWLVLLILVTRVAVVLAYAPPVTHDQSGYEVSAYRLATTGSFAYPFQSDIWTTSAEDKRIDADGLRRFLARSDNAFTMPGYPAFRALLYQLVGGGEPWRVWTRIAQAIISAVGAILMYLLARRFSERAGTVSLLISLVYQPFSTANSHLLTDVLFTYLLVAIVYFFVRWSEQRSMALTAAVGLLFGLALWVRPTIALWLAVAAILMIAFNRGLSRRILAQLALIALIAILAISPWWLRNHALYGRFVPLSTSGHATAMEAIRIDVSSLWPFPWQTTSPKQTLEQKAVEELVAGRVIASKTAGHESDLALSDAYRTQYKLLRNQLLPEYASTLFRSRGRMLLWSLAWPYALAGGFRYLNILTLALHLALLLCFVAAMFAFRRRLDAMLLASVPVYLVAVHAVMIPFNRYVFPVMPFVIVLVAALLDQLTRLRATQSCNDRASVRYEPLSGKFLHEVAATRLEGVDQHQRDEMAIPTLLHTNPLINRLFHRRYATIAELLDVPRGGTVLDFGCGVGCLLPSLSGAGLKVHAIDLVLDYARVVDVRLGLDVSFVESLSDLPDDSLDAIIAADVLEHVDDLPELLELMRRKLRTQGCLVVSSPTENSAYRIGRTIAGFAGKGDYHHADASIVEGTITSSDAFKMDKVRALPWRMPPHLFRIVRFRAQ